MDIYLAKLIQMFIGIHIVLDTGTHSGIGLAESQLQCQETLLVPNYGAEKCSAR